jgi:phage shock protein E
MRIMSIISKSIIAALLALFTSCSLMYDIANTETVREKIKAGALVVDVRTPAEYSSGHFKGAVNIPLAELPHRVSEFGEKNKAIVVYCRSGNRSSKARKFLIDQGYTDVINGGSIKDMMKISDTY